MLNVNNIKFDLVEETKIIKTLEINYDDIVTIDYETEAGYKNKILGRVSYIDIMEQNMMIDCSETMRHSEYIINFDDIKDIKMMKLMKE